METLFKDLRYGFRSLIKHPGFTAIVIVTLALGIGASTAIFSVVNSVVLRRLPYAEADRIVAIQELSADGKRVQVTAPNFYDWQHQSTVFEHLAAIKTTSANLTGADQAERIDISQTSANFFSVFGVQPTYGRLFVPEDEQAGHQPIAVLSYALWQRRFGGDKDVIGKSISLDGKPYTVVGVAPATFQDPFKAELWLPPLRLVPELNERMDVTQDRRGMGYLFSVALLKRGVKLEQAASEMETITARLRQQYPDSNNRRFDRVESLQKNLVGDTSKMLWLLFGAVSFVLLIACANVANLLLARFAGRRREIAARFALGAGRGDVVRDLVTESMLVAVLGGASSVLLAHWAMGALVAFGADLIPRILEVRIDPLALGFSLLVTLLTGLAIGLLPAWQASNVNVLEALKEAGRGSIGSGNRLRASLVVAEVSLSLVVLIAAGLLLTSFARLQRVEPGFEPMGVFTARLALPPQRYSREKLAAFYEQLYRRLATLPGATSAALTDRLPLTGGQMPAVVAVAGRPLPPFSERAQANRHLVSPKYFSTLGIPIRAGRDFDERDNARVPHVAIVNETFARQNFPGEDPIGHTLITGMAQLPSQIVGVVADIRSASLNMPPESDYFLPAFQRPEAFTNILVRTTLSPAVMAPVVRDALRAVDPDLPLLQPQALTTRIAQTVANRKLALVLLGGFAALALLLANLGVYSVMAHLVAFRTGEIGLRMALGASPASVMRMVLAHGRRLTLVGIAVGIAGALVVSRLMQQALFEVDPADPRVYLALSVTLLLVAECASWFPARRATRIDPAIALRSE